MNDATDEGYQFFFSFKNYLYAEEKDMILSSWRKEELQKVVKCLIPRQTYNLPN